MKQLLIVLFMLVSIAGMNQTPPQVPRTTNTTIPVDPNLFTKNRFKIPAFADTTSAVITPDSLGLIIYTKTPKSLWYRDSVVGGGHKWSNPSSISTVNWGDILGDIHNQTDLINYIDSVFNSIPSDSDHLVGVWPIILTRSNDTIYIALDPAFIAATLTDGIKSGCVVSWTGTGLIFDISPCTYVKNTVLYNLPATQITLSPADPTNPRYDVPAVDTDPGYSVVEGDPAAQPVIPQVDPATQLELTAILIPALDTIPAVTGELIYDQNAPPEWNPTTSGTVSFSNTTNPFHLTIAADMSSQTSTKTITFTKPSGTLLSTDFSLFKMYIDLKATIVAASNIQVRFYNGATAVTAAITLTATHGFTKTDLGYQNITIPFSSIAWLNPIFNKVVITFTGVQSGAYIDWVQLQGGLPSGNSNFITDVYRTPGSTQVYKVINGVALPAFIDSVVAGGSGSTEYVVSGYAVRVDSTGRVYTVNADTSILLTQIHFYNSIDSLVDFISNTYVSYSDTAAMLSGYVRRVIAGTNVTVDNTDPQYPIVSASGGSIVSPAAMTKVDDTNVTLTLGGTPATSLLQATSLTLGWTGVLGVSRGGTSYGSYTTGDMLYASGSGTLSKLAIGSAGQHLVVVGGVPVWRDTAAVVGSVGWSTTGNGGLSAGTNFIGTTDGVPFITKTNNIERLRVLTTGEYGVGTATPTAQLHIKSASDGLPTFNAEALSGTGWTSTNWTGSWAAGWSHTTGNTTALTNTLAGVVNTGYRVALTVTLRTAGTFTVTFGGVTSVTITPTAGTYYAEVPIVATTTGTLSITPTSTFDGTIVISIKSVLGNSTPVMIADNSTTGSIEVRTDTSVNMAMGTNALAKNIAGLGALSSLDGLNNTAFGYNALANNISGSNNTGIGTGAQVNNKRGYSNTSVGRNAMAGGANMSGDNNIAIGTGGDNGTTFKGPLYNLTSGRANTVVGSERLAGSSNASANALTSGDENSVFGAGAFVTATSATRNTAVGVNTLAATNTGGNTAVGYAALGNTASGAGFNTGVGYLSLTSLTSGTADALGNSSGGVLTSGARNVALGSGSLSAGSGTTNTGSDNMASGYNAIAHGNSLGAIAPSRNTAVGNYSLVGASNGADDNTTLGYAAGNGTTSAIGSITGKNNIAIGSAAALPSLSSNSQITFWVGATGGSGGYNALTRFTGGQWLLNNTTSSVTTAPNASTALEINGTTGALIIPRVTKTQRDAMTKTAGMIIFQTDNTPGLRVCDGTNWYRFTETAD